jgi:predicted DNA-binding WGR domain protein
MLPYPLSFQDPTTTPPAKKQVVAAPEPPKAARGKKAAATAAPPPPAAVALDPVAESMLPGGSVVVDGADVYDAQLSKVEGRKKVTTFLSLQLVVLPKKGRKAESYHVFSRTGEAGTPGDAEILSTFPSLSDATTEFESVFRSKTGNDWSSRSSFALKRGQFNLAAGPPPALPAAAAPSPPPAPAKRGKKAAALPPGPPALVSTPSTTQAGCIDATALALFPDADVVAHGGDIYDVALSQIDVSKNMDKYYIIQLLCCPGGRKADRYYVFVRWGKTGSNGQNQTHGPYATVEEAIEVFEEKFEEKTKNQWSDRHSFKVKKGHYNLLRVDHTSKANRRLGKGPVAKWEYYVDDHVDGKQTGTGLLFFFLLSSLSFIFAPRLVRV